MTAQLKKILAFFIAIILFISMLIAATLFVGCDGNILVNDNENGKGSNKGGVPLRPDNTNIQGPRAYQFDRIVRFDRHYTPTIEECGVLEFSQTLGRVVHIDKASNTKVVRRQFRFDQEYTIYDLVSGEYRFKLLSWRDSYAFSGNRFIEIYDRTQAAIRCLITGDVLHTRTLPQEQFGNAWSPYAFYGDILSFSGTTWEGGVSNSHTVFVNIVTGQIRSIAGYLGSTMLKHPNLPILYLEFNSVTYLTGYSTLNIIDMLDGTIIASITTPSENRWNDTDLAFIGRGIRFNGKIYNKETGELLSNTSFISEYSSLIGFNALSTIYSSERFDFVNGYSERQKEFAIFDNSISRFVFRSGGEIDGVLYLGDGRFVLTDRHNRSFTVNTDNIVGVLNDNLLEPIRSMTLENIRITQFAFSKRYTDIVLDNGLFFIAIYNTVKVYSADNFDYIKTLYFFYSVTSIDAHNMILAVGFTTSRFLGQNLFFAYVDTNSWSINYVYSDRSSYSIAVFNGIIYFVGGHNRMPIYTYNTATQTISPFLSWGSEFFAPFITINKRDGIMYIGETGVSSSDLVFICLVRNQQLFTTAFMENRMNHHRPIFCGEYVFFAGFIRNHTTGARVFDKERVFPSDNGMEFLGLIYFDNRISVFVAETDGQKVTVVYNTQTGQRIRILGNSERVIKYQDILYLIRPNRDTLYRVAV